MTALAPRRAGPWRRLVVAPIAAQLRQGTTPRQIALTLAAGLVIGVFPVLGTTTLLCALVGIGLRLNQPIIQLVNYLVYPLQLALLFPFYRAGEWLFRQPPVPLFSIAELSARFSADPLRFLADYALVAVYGSVVWLLLAPPAFALIFLALRPPLQALARRMGGPCVTGAQP